MRPPPRWPGALLAAGLTLTAAPQEASQADARPNLVLLLVDDLAHDALGSSGNAHASTPNMDQLSAEGIRFTNAFVTTSICSASRASILTGQYARRTGIYGFARALSRSQLAASYPAVLRGAGYHVGFIGKWGVAPQDPAALRAAEQQFDYWAGFPQDGEYWHASNCALVPPEGAAPRSCSCHGRGASLLLATLATILPVAVTDLRTTHLTTRVIPSQVAEFLDHRPRDRPFCLSVSFKAAHGPWDQYDPTCTAKETGPVSRPRTPAEELERIPSRVRASQGFRNSVVLHDDAAFAGWFRDYRRTVDCVDRAVGAIRGALEEHEVACSTVVILTSDNGYSQGSHGYTGKWLMYESSIRVPLIVLDPRRAPGERPQMALNVDLAPTLVDLAGITPEGMQGASLVGVLDEPEAPLREAWFYEHRKDIVPRLEGVRTARYKYVRYMEEPVVEELFDLELDPAELRSVVGEDSYAPVVSELRARWEALRTELD